MKKLIVVLFAALCLMASTVSANLLPAYYTNQASSHVGYVEAYVNGPIQKFWLDRGAQWGLAPGTKVEEKIVLIPNSVWNKHIGNHELARLHYIFASPVAPKHKETINLTVKDSDGSTTKITGVYVTPKLQPYGDFDSGPDYGLGYN